VSSYNSPITDLDQFVSSYQRWFDSLNPSWHSKNEAGRWVTTASDDGAWENFQKPGLNGLLSIFVCLKWWTEAEETLGIEVSDSWVEGVTDLISVLQGLLEVVPNPSRCEL
jgi:hypothetical protein